MSEGEIFSIGDFITKPITLEQAVAKIVRDKPHVWRTMQHMREGDTFTLNYSIDISVDYAIVAALLTSPLVKAALEEVIDDMRGGKKS